MKIINTLLLLFALTFSLNQSSYAQSAQRMVYMGDPLKITLGIGEERRLTFPGAKLVWADVKDKLKPKLDSLIVGKNVYFKAKEPFKSTRIIIGEDGGSKVYLLDIMATDKKVGNKRLVIVEGEDRFAIADKDKKVVPESVIAPLTRKSSPGAGFKTLLQFASREIYAPERLRSKTVGMHREFINKRPTYHLYRGNQISTHPVVAWRSGGLHVSAIKVQNRTSDFLPLDPRLLRGKWKTALFYHGQLAPNGSPQDTSTLFLISDSPYVDAIRSNPMIKIGSK